MIARLAALLTRWSTRFVPDAFVIAAVLTGLVLGLGLVFTPHGPAALVRFWGNGFWELLSFGMQMCLVIMTGFIVAAAPPVTRLLDGLARAPRSPRQAIALMAAVSMGMAWLNWGLSIVASAVLARAIARRVRGVDYRLLVASAYLGLGCLWHAGFSASAPLLSATPGNFMEKAMGGVVDIGATLFSGLNLGLAAVVLVALTALAAAMHPPPEQTQALAREIDPALGDSGEDEEGAGPAAAAQPPATIAERLETSRAITLSVGACGVTWVAMTVAAKGAAAIDINFVNFVFLIGGLILHGRPSSFLRAAERGGAYLWGVVIQFPLYAGIFGIIKSSGLQEKLAGAFAGMVSAKAYPLFVVWYSGVLNYVVPSGGAKWSIEAPYVVQAARRVGAGLPHTIVAYAWGDMLTDVIQPFWAIPLLAMARLGFRDIMGYCLVFFLAYALIVTGGFALLMMS